MRRSYEDELPGVANFPRAGRSFIPASCQESALYRTLLEPRQQEVNKAAHQVNGSVLAEASHSTRETRETTLLDFALPGIRQRARLEI
jgi:hypothetical protein